MASIQRHAKHTSRDRSVDSLYVWKQKYSYPIVWVEVISLTLQQNEA